MAKKTEKTEDVVVISSELQQSLDVLSQFKTQAEAIKANCEAIIITDDTTFAVAKQNLSKANDLAKYIEEERVRIKAPYLVAGKEIDRIGAELKEPLDSAITHIKNQIKEWDAKLEERKAEEKRQLELKAQEEAKKLEEEQKKSREILESITGKYTKWFKDKLASIKSADDADKVLAYIHTNYPAKDTFLQHGDLAYELRDNYVALINAKKEQIISADMMSEEEKQLSARREEIQLQKEKLTEEERLLAVKAEEARLERERKEAEAKAAEEAEKLKAKQETEKTSGVRKIWKFELVDKSKLPIEWIALDEAAVKSYMKENELQEGIVNGVKFYQEASVRA